MAAEAGAHSRVRVLSAAARGRFFRRPPEKSAPARLPFALLPGRGRELAVVAATRTTAPPERLVAWMQRIDVQRGGYVSEIARFSTPRAPMMLPR